VIKTLVTDEQINGQTNEPTIKVSTQAVE